MGWALGGFGIFIALLLAAGAAFVACKRYSLGWQCGLRDVWIICEEWRRKLSWLWAPREEKVSPVVRVRLRSGAPLPRRDCVCRARARTERLPRCEAGLDDVRHDLVI